MEDCPMDANPFMVFRCTVVDKGRAWYIDIFKVSHNHMYIKNQLQYLIKLRYCYHDVLEIHFSNVM